MTKTGRAAAGLVGCLLISFMKQQQQQQQQQQSTKQQHL